MKEYQSHKRVEAFRIVQTSQARVPGAPLVLTGSNGEEHREYISSVIRRLQDAGALHGGLKEGYLVFYSTGYISWSPAKVFETGYALLAPGTYDHGKQAASGQKLDDTALVAMGHIAQMKTRVVELLDQCEAGLKNNPLDRDADTQPGRWHAQARTSFQNAFMQLTRAVTRPENF